MEDSYANQATISVTESAANTLTFVKLETGVGIGERIAWIISRIEYFTPTPLAAVFNGDGDNLQLGLSQSNAITTPSLTDPSVLDMLMVRRYDYGAAATGKVWVSPLTKDLSTLPGGGLLVVPNPLYGWAVGQGLVSATSTIFKLFYRQITLKDAEFYELWQSRVQLQS